MKKIILLSAVITALFFTSCVKDEIFVGPASIDKVKMGPSAPTSNDTAEISAKVTDLKGVSSVLLYYKAQDDVDFSSTEMVLKDSSIYVGIIPKFANTIKVQYYIKATNTDNLTTVYPSGAPDKLASYTVGASNKIVLYVNEVFANGTKDATDPDWFEIYNASEIDVDINGYMVYDDKINKSLNTASPLSKRVLSNIPVIPAKGYVVITTENNGEAVTFGLSTSGDAVYLEDPSGVKVSDIDFTSISLTGTLSYGHKPDGTGALTIFTTPTKGASNNNAE